MVVHRDLEIRQIPQVRVRNDTDKGFTEISESLSSANWIYTAMMQLTENGSEPSWSKDGWSFVPLNLSHMASTNVPQNLGNANDSDAEVLFLRATNVSITTPAIRGRIECSPHRGLSNISKWLTLENLTDPTYWTGNLNPRPLTQGYQLGVRGKWTQTNAHFSGDHEYMMLLPDPSADSLSNSLHNTSIFTTQHAITCCGNGTSNNTEPVALGFWSSNDIIQMPFARYQWPINFTTKWIGGDATIIQYRDAEFSYDWTPRLVFPEVPSIQARNCKPMIEASMAHVTIERDTGTVQNFEILQDPVPQENAWSDPMIRHSNDVGTYPNDTVYFNVTTR